MQNRPFLTHPFSGFEKTRSQSASSHEASSPVRSARDSSSHIIQKPYIQTQAKAQPMPASQPLPQAQSRVQSKTSFAPTHHHQAPANPAPNTKDPLIKLFNTVVVSTKPSKKRDFSAELCELTDSLPFKAILNAVKHLSRAHGVSERQAAEEIITTFRKLDEMWGDYICREGLEKIRKPR